MANFVLHIELVGDPGSVECCIDELMQAVSFMDLDRTAIHIANIGECDE